MKEQITIVGGSGCIGSHTVDLMLSMGLNVRVIDIKKPHRDDLEFTYCDITDYDSLEVCLKGSEIVFALAAVSDANENYRHPVDSMNINMRGINNLFLACVSADVSRVIFSSSVWVYNECEKEHVDEMSIIPTNYIKHNYTTSKLTGEMLLRSYYEMYGLNYTIMRYGIAYGPRSSPDTVVSTFIKRASMGMDLNITGDGNIYRNFMYVTDHARANVSALQQNACNQTINFDGPESVSILDVANTVKKLTSTDLTINYNNERVGDYKGKFVDNTKSKRLLGWQPDIKFDVGIKKYYEHYNNILV